MSLLVKQDFIRHQLQLALVSRQDPSSDNILDINFIQEYHGVPSRSTKSDPTDPRKLSKQKSEDSVWGPQTPNWDDWLPTHATLRCIKSIGDPKSILPLDNPKSTLPLETAHPIALHQSSSPPPELARYLDADPINSSLELGLRAPATQRSKQYVTKHLTFLSPGRLVLSKPCWGYYRIETLLSLLICSMLL
jgi:hypothetical protein